MSELKSRIKKANAAINKLMPVEPAKIFFREKLGEMGENEKRFRKENPDYRGKGLIITWHDSNAINYEES